MRDEQLYLADIIEAADAIDRFLAGSSEDVPRLRAKIASILTEMQSEIGPSDSG